MLSEQQAGVVENANNHNVVVAGPGTGKSHTMKYVVQRQLETNTNPKPLLVTFTNTATDELKERLESFLTPEQFAQSTISTFDSLMWRLLKSQTTRRLLVGSKQIGFLYRAYKYTLDSWPTHVDSDFEKVSDGIHKLSRGASEADYSPFINAAYESYKHMLDTARPYQLIDLNMVATQVVAAYEKGVVCSEQFTHVIVDEFQDTDQLQLRWLLCMGRMGAKITVVGDDDQSIYSFRGAQGYRNMRIIGQEFKAKMHKLTVCRRCAPQVVETTMSLIKFNQKRIDKVITSAKEKKGVVRFISFENKDKQAQAVVDHLKQTKYKNTGILAPQNMHLDTYEQLLTAADIPVQRLSGKSFFEKTEVIALLNIIKAMSFKRPIEELKNGLTFLDVLSTEVEEVAEVVRKRAINNLYGNLRSDWSNTTNDFASIASNWSLDPKDEGTIHQMLERLIGFIAKTKPGKSANGFSKEAFAAKSLVNMLKKMKGSLLARTKHLVKKLDDSKETQKGIDRECVSLVTYHSSKGLEWDHVIVLSVDEGTTPSDEGNICPIVREEERRKLYVAMTRAENELTISSSGKVSSFLEEAFPDVYNQDANYVKEPAIEIDL